LAVNTTDGFREIFIRQNGDIYVGVNAVLNDVSAAAITSVYNISTIDISPIISIAGTGKILRLENQTTGQKIYLNYTLQENEILTIDFRRGRGNEIVTSNYRGNVPNAILPNSDDFFLAAGKLGEPKENRIACLIIDEVEPVVQLRYTPAHWSIDAGAL
jgi:phage-related protein